MRNFKINFNRYFLNTFESTLECGIHDSINSRIFQPFALFTILAFLQKLKNAANTAY